MYATPARFVFFFFNDTATTEIYTLSLHDALPISIGWRTLRLRQLSLLRRKFLGLALLLVSLAGLRSEEHTSELQSQSKLVCRLLLEKKKQVAPTASFKPARESSFHCSLVAYRRTA